MNSLIIKGPVVEADNKHFVIECGNWIGDNYSNHLSLSTKGFPFPVQCGDVIQITKRGRGNTLGFHKIKPTRSIKDKLRISKKAQEAING